MKVKSTPSLRPKTWSLTIPLDSSEIIAEKKTNQNVEEVAVKASPNSEIIDKKD